MKEMLDYIPETKNLNNYNKYNEIWNSVYNKRLEKVNEDKAVHSANAIVYSEVLKDFIKDKG
jgi:hypothetical protein